MNPNATITPAAAAWARGEDMAPPAAGPAKARRKRNTPIDGFGGKGCTVEQAAASQKRANEKRTLKRVAETQERQAMAIRRLEHVEGMVGRDEAKFLGVLLDAWKNKIDLVRTEELGRLMGWTGMKPWLLGREIARVVLNLRRFLLSTGTGAWVETVRMQGYRLVVERVVEAEEEEPG